MEEGEEGEEMIRRRNKGRGEGRSEKWKGKSKNYDRSITLKRIHARPISLPLCVMAVALLVLFTEYFA